MYNRSGIRWAIVAFLVIGAATAAAVDQADWENTIRQTLQNHWTMSTGQMPILDAKKPSRPLSQTISLALVNGNLVVRTALPSTPALPATQPPVPGGFVPVNYGQFRVKIAPWQEWASLRIVRSDPTGETPAIPQIFYLGLEEFPAGHFQTIGVGKQSGQFTLTMLKQTPQGLINLDFSEEDKDDDYTRPHACRLDINFPRIGMPQVEILITGANFAAMLHDHPKETRQYLRPLLHALNGDSVIPVEPPVAWQVLADGWPPDPKAAAAVNKVLPQLAGGTFRQRSDARKSLEALGTPAALVILRLDRAKLTPEQNAQLDRVVAPYHTLTDDQAKRFRTDPQFLVDCLYCSDIDVRTSAIARLRKLTKLDLAFDPAADANARNATVDVIRGKLSENRFLAVQ